MLIWKKFMEKEILGEVFMSNVLLISTCKEKLHELEFVKPIEDIFKEKKVSYFVRHYSKIDKKDLENCSKVIICGTSLQDNLFIDNLNSFGWLKYFNKPVLGICAGMQIIGITRKGKLKNKEEIGFYSEDFKKSFLGLSGKQEVYHLHNNFIDFKKLKDFDVYSESNGIVQAVKHKNKEIYGVLFHPEVRQKDLIKKFVELK